ncbi:LysR family transcriptional regulator [Alcaligenaceae bacterium A4P071]|nr:LysR family transcriptional regulator [Alcaligenaceae bacterium A4P071]
MNAPSVQLNDIALFVEVAKRRSFTLAAQHLSIPTSTLSRRILALEDAVGMRLLNRNTRRLDLTEAGAVYLERCQFLIEEARLAHEPLLALSRQPHGLLQVAMPQSLGALILPNALGAFITQYPDLDCAFDLSMRSPATRDGGFDVMIHFGQLPEVVEGDVRELVSLDQHLYASQAYLDRYGTPQTPDDLSRHQCLRSTAGPEHSTWTLAGADGKRIDVPVTGRIAANSVSMGSVLAGLGLGITRLPQCRAMLPALTQNSLHRVLPDWRVAPVSIYAICPSPLLPAKTRAFLSFIEPLLAPLQPGELELTRERTQAAALRHTEERKPAHG